MASLRRHLASLGLAVVLCHVVMQVLVPAALCCQKPLSGGTRAEAHECCPEGSHPGKVCPMHANRAGKRPSGDTDPDCTARPLVDLHDILMTLSNGGVMPALLVLASPVGSESAPAFLQPAAPHVVSVPPGPPPRA
jgi:hypothetical protein